MTKKIKLRIKYCLSIVSMMIFTFFNAVQIPIQDNYLNFMKWALGFVCAGFVVKSITGIWKKE